MPSSTSPGTSIQPPTLPPAATFDFIPPLHALLSRLLVLQSDTTGNANALAPKELATEAASIKIKIQKARAAVQALPDVQRSVSEQRAEIGELEKRIRAQRGVLWEVAEAGRKIG
ncbi:hypothetical protein MMC34_003148 [Xylographa carneopallida]|nr:hypothetical protein [Xylographa carneopallida]